MQISSGARSRQFVLALSSILLAFAAITASATGKTSNGHYFKWIATFDVIAGNGSAVAEIVDVTSDYKQLIYTDADNEAIGFVDIRNPRRPKGLGTLDVGGEPTSLVSVDPYVLVAIKTSDSFTDPTGQLVVIDRKTRAIIKRIELEGQPDSIAISPDKQFVAIVIENERDEDFMGGFLPQYPSGKLLIIDLKDAPKDWTLREADLSPLVTSAFEGTDLEAEFVDINNKNEAVVTFQENNHLAIVDLKSGKVISDFPAGSVDLKNVDTAEEDLINLDSNITKRREPDSVTWVGDKYFATANEGDYEDENEIEGGSRGFTVFNKKGDVVYEPAESFEHLLVAAGHYNEGRSENKGVEPEAAEHGVYGRQSILFIGSERSNAIGVYDVTSGLPKLMQVLPTGIGPEGLKAIPARNLLVASTEADVEEDGIPTMINIYEKFVKRPRYPMIASAPDIKGLPIPWVALSGLVGDPWDRRTLYAVSDSFLASGFIYTIDVRSKPALIVDRLEVTGASTSVDLEGIAVGDDGYFWLGSEGRSGTRPNAILKVDPNSGAVVDEIVLPAGLSANARNNGFEGIAVAGPPGKETIYVAIQRAWPDAGDVDKLHTRIGRYDVGSGEWGFVYYPLEAEGNGGWIGLSELTLLPDGSFAVIERDKGWGPTTPPVAELKAIYRINLSDASFKPFDATLDTIDKYLVRDVLPALSRRSIFTAEKLEGLAVSAAGTVFIVTDNDGVDDAPGETLFMSLGRVDKLVKDSGPKANPKR